VTLVVLVLLDHDAFLNNIINSTTFVIPLLGSTHSRSNIKRYAPPCPTLTLRFVDSLTAAAQVTIQGMLSYYGGQSPGGTPGIFNQIEGYYWWMAGAAWNVLSHAHVYLLLLVTYAILVVNRRLNLQRSSHRSNAVSLKNVIVLMIAFK
jgi:hypothetical protein